MRYSRDISFCSRLLLSRHALITAKRMTVLQKPCASYAHFSTMLFFWSLVSLVRNSVVLAVYLSFSVACCFTVHEQLLVALCLGIAVGAVVGVIFGKRKLSM